MPDPVADDGATVAQEDAPQFLVGADGKFAETWRESLPEDVRAEKCLDRVPDFTTLAKNYVNAERALMTRVGLPGEKSDPKEWDAFYEKLGRPKTAEEYQFDVPKERAELYDETRLKASKAALHALGLTQKQAAGVLALYDQELADGLKAQEEEKVKAPELAQKLLREKWGAEYDSKLHLANRMIEENVSAEAKPELLKFIGNNPVVADFLASMAGKFMEAGMIHPESGVAGATGIQQEIDKLRATPGFGTGELMRTNRKEWDRISERLDLLYNKLYVPATPKA